MTGAEITQRIIERDNRDLALIRPLLDGDGREALGIMRGTALGLMARTAGIQKDAEDVPDPAPVA